MAGISSFNVTLKSSDGLDKFNDRNFTVKPGARAFLPKDDPDNIVGFGIGRASKALGSNKFYQADKHNAWIDSPTISRRHAVFSVERNPPHLTIINVAATHGLFVNNRKVDENESFVLTNGDKIRLSGDVRRGEELIPPRTFEVFAHAMNNTPPPSSPEDIQQVRSFKVPEADSDEEESAGEVEDMGSSIVDEQETSNIDPSETGLVEDSMAHSFSDVESSEDEGLDCGLPYGHEGHDYEISEDESDNELDDNCEDPGRDSEYHNGREAQDVVTQLTVDPETRELLEVQSPQPEKPNNQRLANLVAASGLVDFFDRHSAAATLTKKDNTKEEQIIDMTSQSTRVDEARSDDRADRDGATQTRLGQLGQHSDQSAPSMARFDVFDSKVSKTVDPKSVEADPPTSNLTRDTHDGEADTERRQRMAEMLSRAAQYEPMDCGYPRASDNSFVSSVAPSMSLDRILGSPINNSKTFTSPDTSTSFSGDWTVRDNWISPFPNAPSQSAANTGGHPLSNPWAMYEPPISSYQEGPFASVKIENMLNNEPPRCGGFQAPGASHDMFQRAMEADGIPGKKSGISIFDIVENPHNKKAEDSRPLKRKVAELVDFSDALETAPASESDAMNTTPTVPLESASDIQKSSVQSPENDLKLDDLNISSRPLKKLKPNEPSSSQDDAPSTTAGKPVPNSNLKAVKNTLATAAAGAVVGGLAVFSALAFLPEAIFQ